LSSLFELPYLYLTYRAIKLASEVLGNCPITKTPPNIITAILITPASSAVILNAPCAMPLVHIVELLTESAQRHDHLYDVREVFFDCSGASAAFVTGHSLYLRR
jgi:hypothetical protein